MKISKTFNPKKITYPSISFNLLWIQNCFAFRICFAIMRLTAIEYFSMNEISHRMIPSFLLLLLQQIVINFELRLFLVSKITFIAWSSFSYKLENIIKNILWKIFLKMFVDLLFFYKFYNLQAPSSIHLWEKIMLCKWLCSHCVSVWFMLFCETQCLFMYIGIYKVSQKGWNAL